MYADFPKNMHFASNNDNGTKTIGNVPKKRRELFNLSYMFKDETGSIALTKEMMTSTRKQNRLIIVFFFLKKNKLDYN